MIMSCNQPQHHADYRGNQCCHNSHQKGNPHGIEKPAEDIPSNLIGSQPELCVGRAAEAAYDGIRIIGRNDGRKKRRASQDHQYHKADRGQMVLPESAHYGLKIAFS